MSRTAWMSVIGVVGLSWLAGGCAQRAPERDREPAARQATLEVEEGSTVEVPLGIEAALYPPKLVMDHQAALALEPEQRSAILKSLRATQAELVELDWKLRGEKEQLALALSESRVDEERAMAIARRVMNLENQVKTLHLGMLIGVKNELTQGQQLELDGVRVGGGR